ncbi:ycaR [Wigglesworthia glossinidia endosymbiont of Glossina brevipalpis]|uniref:Methyltransferase activator Trm112 homolog n=1 Tax=Wigglesworthia glossinidia brevipalpis TaxID=36870 RepID=Y252_WIGBR|nr:RecName: Full=UPF0434 protein WIGBR2520 [Wigglesworthia glossinidia endosymbiont of Glossina brevipalpis]BAC24398.1 ycaR [Wigglesworthia glossinidia endosymbiont of Glossina brevipalpis]
MDKKLLNIIACPICNKKLNFDLIRKELICEFDSVAFPIKDGIPILLRDSSYPIKKR